MEFCSTVALLGLLVHAGTAEHPSSRWTSPGGATDGAGVADVEPLVEEPEVLWSFGPLELEGEPLVWDEHVIAAGIDATGRRALVVLDGRTGALLSRTPFSAAEPLALALWDERIAVRTAANRVDVFRLRGARLVAERSFVHAGTVSVPLLIGDELLLREGSELVCHELGQRDERWRARVAGDFRGAPAARGDDVFGLWYDGEGWAHLARLDRASGEVRADVRLGQHADGRVPAESDDCELVVHEREVFLRLPLDLPASSGASLAWARVPLEGPGSGGPITLHDFLAPPLETADGRCGPERAGDGDVRWVLARREDGRERGIELATRAHHAWLCERVVPASRARGVLYLGPCAADERSLRVLWRRAEVPRFRPVPVPRGLLVVEGPYLRRLGQPPGPGDPVRDRARAIAAEAGRDLAERLAQLASRALRALDRELAARLVAEAEELGATGRALQLARAELERAGTGHTTPPDPRKSAAVLAEERAARSRLPEELARAARLAADPALRHALLVELFARASDDPAGLELLAAELPAGATIAPGEARSWLELLEVSRALSIELVLEPADRRLSPAESARLQAERAAWRPDAVAFASPRLLVITAGAAPGAVARTLQAGELVCDVLERTLGGARLSAERAVAVLYSTREEYRRAGGEPADLEGMLGWTAGHYDLGADVARMFLPEGDEEGARLRGVFAHELAHDWLASRSTFGPPRAAPETPGFWIAEAIATWAEELRLDPAAGAWRADGTWHRGADSLDTLAGARAGDLIPWRAFLSASCAEHRALETRPTCRTSLAWQLGSSAERSQMQLFYAQGGALAHYLYGAEGGRHRELLLRAVAAFHRGAPLDVAAALGTTPDDLGARVQAFARSAVE